jgi:hypothetical protein
MRFSMRMKSLSSASSARCAGGRGHAVHGRQRLERQAGESLHVAALDDGAEPAQHMLVILRGNVADHREGVVDRGVGEFVERRKVRVEARPRDVRAAAELRDLDL